MKTLKNLWFWFGLTICPIILLFALFRAGQLLGEILYSSTRYNINQFDIIIFISAILAGFEFARSVRQARLRF